ncbi:S-adenosyl-L-methionine-dependent methyltransferases superfamily protein [Prunus dulcis]|uniref:Calmodulin-lysine N-methyltransferase n=1 Tax=Prunus dulcis TaxID=3755 RepID=A0A4Y1RUI9_PRUDU|nr:S-adenosyl-L-methionine-dependent methyltransferases superfamily protein [Prunus dulcis]
MLPQRMVDHAELSDFEICNKYNIDNTGLVSGHQKRSKRVIELGSGYGLAGLVIAAVTEASEVVISDGNPQHNIDANSKAFGGTRVKSMMLHWNQNEISNISSTFDLIVASDWYEFHNGLAQIVKFLLGKVQPSEAIFLSPKRGDSLDKFLEKIKENDLRFSLQENYDAEIWKHHTEFMNGAVSWPSYQKDHCYPLLIRITPSMSKQIHGQQRTLLNNVQSSEQASSGEQKSDMPWFKFLAFIKRIDLRGEEKLHGAGLSL